MHDYGAQRLGLGVGKWLNNLGAVGMALPVLILIALGVVSFSRFGSATHFSWSGFIPRVQVRDLIFWSTIFFAFSGCECASFMGDEIKNARRVVPRALILAGAVITIGYIAGTFAMLVALPSSSISGLGGFMTAIDFLCRRLGLSALIAPVAILVGISNVGAAAAYLSSTARCLLSWGSTTTCQRSLPVPFAMEDSLCRFDFLWSCRHSLWCA